ncbi:MAG: polysulfide reductase [Candidatus Dadabacteria bacterium]|nr:MAG: polysulfide reductase [Candidatus Dadabacteria bacterium]
MKYDRERIERDLLRSVEHTTPWFYLAFFGLLAVVGWGFYAYFTQLRYGLGVTGMQEPVTWGFYIVNFVFFIGISHAGTLISAILRLSKAEWRRPITRMAEVITAIVLAIGGLHPIIDLGRPDRILHIFYNGRLQSPLLWDVTSITAYFAASTVYLYVPMIPDIARLRDRGVRPRWLYRVLAWGWIGTPEQHRVLERAINILMVMVIPIAVSVHTVISFIFAMTLQPGWHSTIFGPYFVAGAIFSGIAALFLVILTFRRVYHLEHYIKDIHLYQLSRLLLIMSLVWFYFTFAEYLTGYYGGEPVEFKVIMYKFTGRYMLPFWGMVLCNFVIPVVFLSFRRLCTPRGIFIASVAVTIGMWLERLNIIVPTLENPAVPFPTHFYVPSWVEWGIFAWGVGVFCLGFLLFAKFFPLISIWEIEEGIEQAEEEVDERIRSYQPDFALVGQAEAVRP